MTPLPTSLAAAPTISGTSAPQSLLPAETAPGDGQTLATAFLDQLSKLLQSTALTTRPLPGEASGTQPGSTPTAPAQADATSTLASSQAQLILSPLPVVAPPAKQSETQVVQTRGLGGSKPKAESATPKSHPSPTSGEPAIPIVAVPPAPDPIAPPPVSALPAHDGTAQHGPARDQHSDQSATGSTDPSVSSVSVSTRLDGPNPAMADLDRQQTQDAPTRPAPVQPQAEAVAVMQPAAPQSTAPSVRSVATTNAPTSAPAAHSGSPTAQITPALMQMGHAPDGAQRLTVRLDPPELGQVQIKIDRPSDASARVEITVQKQETLTLLLRDQPQLQRALDQAGVPADGRTVTFHVAAPAPPVRTETGTMPVPGTGAGGLTGDGSHGAARQHGRPGQQQRDTTDDDGAEFTPISARGWLRAGLDITA